MGVRSPIGVVYSPLPIRSRQKHHVICANFAKHLMALRHAEQTITAGNRRKAKFRILSPRPNKHRNYDTKSITIAVLIFSLIYKAFSCFLRRDRCQYQNYNDSFY